MREAAVNYSNHVALIESISYQHPHALGQYWYRNQKNFIADATSDERVCIAYFYQNYADNEKNWDFICAQSCKPCHGINAEKIYAYNDALISAAAETRLFT